MKTLFNNLVGLVHLIVIFAIGYAHHLSMKGIILGTPRETAAHLVAISLLAIVAFSFLRFQKRTDPVRARARR